MDPRPEHSLYSLEDFLTDDSFCAYCLGTREEDVAYWKGWLAENPQKKKTADEARKLYFLLNGQNTGEQFEKDAEKFRQAVSQHIHRGEEISVPLGKGRVVPVYRWMAAAAVVLFMVCGLWLIVGRDRSEEPSVALAPGVKQDIAPGGDKAILTLADGTKVILDTANNGALTKQGNVTIIKLNGQLAYNKQGSAATEVLYNTISTPRGGQYQLVLSDGSKVWLNAASSLRFPTAFAGKERRVELSGEGYFEVAHNEEKPFHVTVGSMDVQVLGTHFNINSYSDEDAIKTTLLEGRVMVKKQEKLVYLNPGQQAVVQPSEDNIKVDYDVNIEEVMAWKNGKFLFNSASVSAVMRQVARWYDVEVVYEKKTDETISGSLPRSENISQLLKILEATGKVGFKINGRQIIVQPK